MPQRLDGEAPRFAWPIFASAPLWTTGSDWIATAEGGRAEIRLLNNDGTARGFVRWRPDRSAVADSDRIESAQWTIWYTGLVQRQMRRLLERAGTHERVSVVKRQALALPFADSTPEVTGLIGSQGCLWIAGFQPRDGPTGIASTWLVLDVHTGALEKIVRIPRFAARLRHVDAYAAYVTVRDTSGAELVERYPLPRLSCSAAS